MDRHAIVSECRQQAAHCRTRAETANDERVQALLVSMALIWTKLAEEAEPIQRTKRGVANDDTSEQTQVRLEAPPTQCPRCKTLMKVRKWVPLPGRKFVDVDYRCDECGAEVLRAVPMARES
jgi:hypothetical protein